MKIGWSPIWILRLNGMMTSSKWRLLRIYYVYVFSIVSYDNPVFLSNFMMTNDQLYLWRQLMKITRLFIWISRLGRMMTSSKWRILGICHI